MPRPGHSATARALGTSRTPSLRTTPSRSNTVAPSIWASVAQRAQVGGLADAQRRRAGSSSSTGGPGSSWGRRTSSAPMPAAPRSCTANSRRSRSTRTPSGSVQDTTSSQRSTGGSRCQVKPSQRATPKGPATRTPPVGWRWTTTAPNAWARTPRSRSEPAGRSKTSHSSGPSERRRSQLDRPSAKRRAASRGWSPIAVWAIRRSVAGPQVAGSVRGSRTAPPLGTRRSWTTGRRARSTSCRTSSPAGPSGSVTPASSSSRPGAGAGARWVRPPGERSRPALGSTPCPTSCCTRWPIAATVTLNRPEARNALSAEVRACCPRRSAGQTPTPRSTW